jgi:FkbM family methyltransferase
MNLPIFNRIHRGYEIWKLTKKYFRAKQIIPGCNYYINGKCQTIYGEQALSMVLDIVSHDSYGIKKFKHLDTIVDIGANIGIFSLHASTLFPQAKILAYEPCNIARIDLEKNINGFNNIKIYPYAVGAVNQAVCLNFQADLSACYVTSDEDSSSGKGDECQMISLDDVVAKLDSPISLLKLDCEGSEYEIMQLSSFETVKYVVGELHTCPYGNPELGIKILNQKDFIIDKWLPFSDGTAGVFWASNRRY